MPFKSRILPATDWKKVINDKFGVTLDDGGAVHPRFEHPASHGRTWDEQNMIGVYSGLSRINNALDGRLKTIVGSATFTLNTHPPANTSFFGFTSGTTVDFYADSLVPLENIYHEFGHVLDSLPGKNNIFSSQLHNPSFIKNNVVNTDALISSADKFRQHSSGDVTEQWADVFLNYVAENINQDSPEGADMYRFITGALTVLR